eukprot:TRINITY_DN70_c0_g1_i4.p1 TRINITY_DN70_c0_g1~~TRINITY_DN70_c0_g1_i4.p1  ORF type:complete len:100 (-),score=16.61 TRINITY_DN70_c0_g1_i4:196-495(-)
MKLMRLMMMKKLHYLNHVLLKKNNTNPSNIESILYMDMVVIMDNYEATNRKRKREVNKPMPDISNYNYGLFVPIESGLDINQCHTWTEHQVGECVWWRL